MVFGFAQPDLCAWRYVLGVEIASDGEAEKVILIVVNERVQYTIGQQNVQPSLFVCSIVLLSISANIVIVERDILSASEFFSALSCCAFFFCKPYLCFQAFGCVPMLFPDSLTPFR